MPGGKSVRILSDRISSVAPVLIAFLLVLACSDGGSSGSSGQQQAAATAAPTSSIKGNGDFFDTAVANGDVAEYDGAAASLVIQESAVFSSDVNIDAAAYLGSGNIVFSTEAAFTEGPMTYLPDSLIEYDMASSALSLYFDGNAHFDNVDENIDAVDVLENGNLALSTWGNASLGGSPTFHSGDVVEYDPATRTVVGTLFSANALAASGDLTGDNDVDAVQILGPDLVAISLSAPATIFGTAIQDGDIAVVDLAARTAIVEWTEAEMFTRDEDLDAILAVR
jgi:hypothetical protein